jgi:xanthine/CO dehydrogenase XdhC/CoxF family maturation factor
MIRTELNEMIALAERLRMADQRATLATLFSANGSTYRTLGSMMVGGPSSSFIAGGVSGGCLEEYIARRGLTLSDERPAAMLTFETDPDGQHDDTPALGCGGTIDVLVERFTPEHLEFLLWLLAAHESDTCSSAACIVDTSKAPALKVERIVWHADGWTGSTTSELESLRAQSLSETRCMEKGFDGSRRALVYFVPPRLRLVILGAGSDSQALCRLAHSLGWHVTVADRRARLATTARFPEADCVVAADWWPAMREITFTPRTAVVLMTHSFADDVEILPLLEQLSMAYVGSLGPERRRLKLLVEVDDGEGLDKTFAAELRGPIGLDLGDRSAAGIAVSVMAEILAVVNGRTATPLSNPARLFDASAQSAAADSHG